MSEAARLRAMLAGFVLAVGFTLFSFRLIHLQVCRHEEYAALAAKKHVTRQTINANRGTIQDVHGEILADNEPAQTVIADGALIKNPQELAAVLAGPLQMKARELEEKLATDRRYVVLKKRVPQTVTNALRKQLRDLSLKGIACEEDSIRVYPNGQMLCHALGFMNCDHDGVQGIERVMNNHLRGRDGFRFSERDRKGNELVPYRGQEQAPRNGCNVRLTVDMGLQNIVENEIDAATRQFRPKSATVILMRPKTGEILALANRPSFDLNDLGKTGEEAMRNRAITDMVEPGSTFKIVTAAAALNEKLVNPQSMIFCENGAFHYCGKTLHDHHPYADLTWEEILSKSSNIGAAKLAMNLGDEKFHEYIRRFGFGERTGIELPGEIPGVIHPPHRWSKISITRIPMGHEVAVTPLQSITAMCAIANGGRLMKPQIVHSIVDEQGAPMTAFAPLEVRRVVSEETAARVREALKAVVSEKGTAALAKVAGFTVAGKTGTAQKPDQKGGYLSDKYVVSFIGFLPADDPEFVGFVMLDEPVTRENEYYGGIVAAPIFSRIAARAARYLNLEPHIEQPTGSLALSQSAPSNARLR